MEENEIPTHPKLTFSVVSAIHVYFFRWMAPVAVSFILSPCLSPRIIYLNFILAIYKKKISLWLIRLRPSRSQPIAPARASMSSKTNSTGLFVWMCVWKRSYSVRLCCVKIPYPLSVIPSMCPLVLRSHVFSASARFCSVNTTCFSTTTHASHKASRRRFREQG